MLAFSEIVDFLLDLLRDPEAQAAFEQDPQGALAAAGLEGITADDVRDARLQLADAGGVSASGGSSDYSYRDHGDDPVREIHYTTQHYQADEVVAPEPGGQPDVVAQSSSAVSIDDRDSFFFQTFNSDDDVTLIDDSVTDNSVTDNSSTDVDVLAIEGSFNSDDDNVAIDAQNSFNTEESVVAIQANDNDTFTQNNDLDVLNAENSFNDAPPAAAAPPTAAEPVAAEIPVAEIPAEEIPAEEPPADEPPAEDDAADDPADDPADVLPA